MEELNPTQPTVPTIKKVVIVNGTEGILDMIESALDAGTYDTVYIENNRHAYTQIKRVQPDLVILCLHVDDVTDFHVLTMLKLDEETRHIPVLTYTTQHEPLDEDYDTSEPESDFVNPIATMPLN